MTISGPTGSTIPHIPYWIPFPVNNNRTAWRPISIPIIFVETDRRDPSGIPYANSAALNIEIVVEDVPQKAYVAGQDHIGLLFPDHELYGVTLTSTEIASRRIDPVTQSFVLADGVTPVDFSHVTAGCFIVYTTRTGVSSLIAFYPTCNYYDFSDITVDVEDLPSDIYYLDYKAFYNVRVISTATEGQLNCIDVTKQATAIYRFKFNHPGQIMDNMYRLTPQPYLTNDKKSKDSTVAFYRPLTDILQDIFDEQNLLVGINWIDKVPPQYVPYLAYLIGFDMPYFPGSLDNLRRVMLRNIVKLQQLKGSRRALIDMFKLFGYTIYISNLYSSVDGQRFIAPGQELPPSYADQTIEILDVPQIEPLVAGYSVNGYGQTVLGQKTTSTSGFTIPLLYVPAVVQTYYNVANIVTGGSVIIDSYLVVKGSQADRDLQDLVTAISADPSEYGKNVGGALPQITSNGIVGYSQNIIAEDETVATDQTTVGVQPPFVNAGVSIDREHNVLSLTTNGAILYDDRYAFGAPVPTSLYSFATYSRQELVVPDSISDLHSNRFNVQILTNAGQDITPDVLEFMVDFLYKLKAFHSIVNVIIYGVELTETYLVTDFCVGGLIQQYANIDAGRLQVPPAIIPRPASDCLQDPADLGYKPADLQERAYILANLPEEFAAWRALDARAGHDQSGDLKINPVIDNLNQRSCKFNYLGQNRTSLQYGLISSNASDGWLNAPTLEWCIDDFEFWCIENIDSSVVFTEFSVQSTIEYEPGPLASGVSSGNQQNLALSPIVAVERSVFYPTGTAGNSNSYIQSYGKFNREYTENNLKTFCELDGVSNYCYKGRVSDEILNETSLPMSEISRGKTCQIGMGYGFYYTYPMRWSSFSKSPQISMLAQPLNKPLPASSNSFLGRLLRSYGVPADESLHYCNRSDAGDAILCDINYLALQRPSLDIEIPTMHFPGTRLLTMGSLMSNYTSSWSARPWDDKYALPCGPEVVCGSGPTYLNATLSFDESGNQILVFDDTPFVATGNSLVPDVPSMGSHALGTDWSFQADEVVQSVMSSQAAGNIAITLECTVEVGQTNEYIHTADPLFSSANNCGTHHTDWSDGYPGAVGVQACSDITSYNAALPTDMSDNTILDELDVPGCDGPIHSSALFFLCSGILVGKGVRLGCGCIAATCIGGETALECSLDAYLPHYTSGGNLVINYNSPYDFEQDQLEYDSYLVETESIGVSSMMANGRIPSMFELVS